MLGEKNFHDSYICFYFGYTNFFIAFGRSKIAIFLFTYIFKRLSSEYPLLGKENDCNPVPNVRTKYN